MKSTPLLFRSYVYTVSVPRVMNSMPDRIGDGVKNGDGVQNIKCKELLGLHNIMSVDGMFC